MKKQKNFLMLLISFAVLLIFSVFVSAAETTVDFDRTGSLSITLRDDEHEDQIVKDSVFTLYQVGSIVKEKVTLTFELTEWFAGADVSLADLSAPGLAAELWTYAQQRGMIGLEEKAGEDGTVRFEGLELGLYLVLQKGVVSGYYSTDPFLVSVPMSESTGWTYDIEANPKVQRAPDELVSLSVRKVWEDKNSRNRPASVEIQLLKDANNVAETIRLNEDNNWSHSWKNLASEYEWTIREKNVPKGYTVSYRISGDEVIVTNTATLIQTGQLNWPIAVLAAGGLLLLAAGYWLYRTPKRDRKNET